MWSRTVVATVCVIVVVTAVGYTVAWKYEEQSYRHLAKSTIDTHMFVLIGKYLKTTRLLCKGRACDRSCAIISIAFLCTCVGSQCYQDIREEHREVGVLRRRFPLRWSQWTARKKIFISSAASNCRAFRHSSCTSFNMLVLLRFSSPLFFVGLFILIVQLEH